MKLMARTESFVSRIEKEEDIDLNHEIIKIFMMIFFVSLFRSHYKIVSIQNHDIDVKYQFLKNNQILPPLS